MDHGLLWVCYRHFDSVWLWIFFVPYIIEKLVWLHITVERLEAICGTKEDKQKIYIYIVFFQFPPTVHFYFLATVLSAGFRHPVLHNVLFTSTANANKKSRFWLHWTKALHADQTNVLLLLRLHLLSGPPLRSFSAIDSSASHIYCPIVVWNFP